MIEIGLSLGTNLGNRIANLRNAAEQLSQLPKTAIIARSRIYETKPVGVQPQHQGLAYLNAVLIISTELNIDGFSNRMHAIETAMGRIRSEDRFAPRTIDIDMLYAGNDRRENRDLTLPHPHWAKRRFVVQPLADVRPALRLPGINRTVVDVLATLPEPTSDVVMVEATW